MVQQQARRGKCVNNNDNSTCKVKQAVASQFHDQVSRVGLSKTYAVISKFQQEFTAKHQKGRCVPINLQPRITAELDRMQKNDISKSYLVVLTETSFHR